jgi:hypothetical protein
MHDTIHILPLFPFVSLFTPFFLPLATILSGDCIPSVLVVCCVNHERDGVAHRLVHSKLNHCTHVYVFVSVTLLS